MVDHCSIGFCPEMTKYYPILSRIYFRKASIHLHQEIKFFISIFYHTWIAVLGKFLHLFRKNFPTGSKVRISESSARFVACSLHLMGNRQLCDIDHLLARNYLSQTAIILLTLTAFQSSTFFYRASSSFLRNVVYLQGQGCLSSLGL